MPLAEAKHHQLLGVVIEPFQLLEAEAPNRIEVLFGKERRPHHGDQEGQGIEDSLAKHRCRHLKMGSAWRRRPLDPEPIKGVTETATVERASSAQNQLREDHSMPVPCPTFWIARVPDRKKPAEGRRLSRVGALDDERHSATEVIDLGCF